MTKKCLIIGLGKIGMGYDLDHDSEVVYGHARAISLHPYFELAGAVDVVSSLRSTFENHYNRPAFHNISVAISQLQPSVVIIATPSETHASVLNMVLSHTTPNAILCEKPLAYDLVEAREMVEVCSRKDVKLYVNYPRRSDPGVIEVKRRFKKKEIVGPIKGVAWYSKGFLNNGSHFFNLLEFWLGNVVGFKLIDSGRLWAGIDPEPSVEVEYEQGTVVFIPVWEEAFSHCTLELLSQSGRLRYEQNGLSIEWQSIISDSSFAGYDILNPSPEIIPNGAKCYQWYVFEQLAASLAGKHNTLCTGRQALNTLEHMNKITKERQL